MKKKIFALVMLFVFALNVPAYAAYDNYGEKFQDIMDLIEENYYDKDAVDKDALFKKAVNSMLNSLDPYSAYMENKELEKFIDEVNNHYEGIGVMMTMVDGSVEVTQVFEGGPAFKAGVKMRDVFKAVDGKDVSGLELQEIADLVKGEKGTSVSIDFIRGNETIKVDIVRDAVDVAAVREKDIAELLPELDKEVAEKIAYIGIETFSDDVHKKLGDIMDKIEKEGKKDIIVDLRDNGGGNVFSGVKTAEYFTDKGPVLILKDNEGMEDKYLGAGKKGDKNIVILINNNTASASEFVAGSAQEDGVKLVGDTTYGKGIAQAIEDLKDGDSVKLSTYSFYTGEGKAINKLGIQPDYRVKTPELINTEIKFHLNDKYKDVYILEKGLSYLGYDLEPDEVYDENTFNIIKKIQGENDLYPYGVFDFGTRDLVNDLILDDYRKNDRQLKKAVEVLIKEIK